jgi:hypothetical protein
VLGRFDPSQRRGCLGEQPHGCTGYVVVAAGCGDRCRGRPDDADHGRHGVGLDQLDGERVAGTVESAAGESTTGPLTDTSDVSREPAN